jgi:hypothetical protein
MAGVSWSPNGLMASRPVAQCTSIEDPPGMRRGPAGQIYLAYIRDPDGDKLAGVYRPPA